MIPVFGLPRDVEKNNDVDPFYKKLSRESGSLIVFNCWSQVWVFGPIQLGTNVILVDWTLVFCKHCAVLLVYNMIVHLN